MRGPKVRIAGMVTAAQYPASPTVRCGLGWENDAVGLSVLVVDDDAPFRDLATRILTSWGHTVVGQAGTLARALELAVALSPDLALVDYGLPDGDGLDLTRQLRAMAHPPQVVVISSDSDRATVEGSNQAGAKGFFLKEEIYGASFRTCVAGQSGS